LATDLAAAAIPEALNRVAQVFTHMSDRLAATNRV
jgi:hypothetical protein